MPFGAALPGVVSCTKGMGNIKSVPTLNNLLLLIQWSVLRSAHAIKKAQVMFRKVLCLSDVLRRRAHPS